MATAENKNWIRTFQVIHPVRHRKGFTVYKVISKMFPRTYPEGVTAITVWKRYTDFKKLYSELHLIHSQLHLKGEFPRFAKARVFGRFDYEVVEERRKAALGLLEFSAKHSLLFTSKVFIRFFENGYSTKDLMDSGIESESENLNQRDFETCLTPDRMWCEPFLAEDKTTTGEDCDGMSTSSINSTPPEAPTDTTDTDSMISSAALSCASDLLTNGSTSVETRTYPSDSSITTMYFTKSESSCSISISADQLKATVESDASSSKSKTVNEFVSSILLGPTNVPVSNGKRQISVSLSCSSLSSLDVPVLPPRLVDKSESTMDLDLQIMESSYDITKDKLKPVTTKAGFGFFDFLPNFSKKQSGDRQHSLEKLLNDSLTASYICEAAGHFAVAQQYESNREFQRAFKAYKEGIRILLAGAKEDKDLKRKRLVKSKLDRYLDRAEFIYENHLILSPNQSPAKKGTGHDHNSSSPVSFNAENVWQNALASDFSQKKLRSTENMKPSRICDMKEYKLVRVIYKQVYLVVNIKVNVKPKCCAIKMLLKSSDPIYPSKPTLIPNNIPFMVKLVQWFETEHTYILVMQYAGGGRLKDFVDLYQTKSVAFELYRPEGNELSRNVVVGAEDTNEITSGEDSNLTHDMMSVLDALAQLGSDKESCESYNKLFEEYSETIKDERTQLATYSKSRNGALSCEIESDEKEASEITSKPITPFKELQSENFAESRTTREFHHIDSTEAACSLSSSPSGEYNKSNDNFEDIKNSDATGTEKLIEISKVLLRTVNQTLATVRFTEEDTTKDHTLFSKAKSYENENMNNQSDSDFLLPDILLKQNCSEPNEIGSCQPENKNRLGNSNVNKTSSQLLTVSENAAVKKDDEFNGGDGDKVQHNFQSHSGDFGKNNSKNLIVNFESVLNSQNDVQGSESELVESELEPENLIPERMVPECCIKIWAAEIVLALEELHICGLAIGDLEMKNVLLGEDGHILLSLQCQWSEVDQTPEVPNRKNEFSAPEIRNSMGLPKWKIHPSSDFWSLGVILFELVTGQTLRSAHPEGFRHSDSALTIPDKNCVGDLISHNGRSLLAELLQYTPSLRLGYYGAIEVKSHPFFDGFDWDSALAACLATEQKNST